MVTHNRIGHDINRKHRRECFEPILDELFAVVVTGPPSADRPTQKRPPHTPTEHVQDSHLIIPNDLTSTSPPHHTTLHRFGHKRLTPARNRKQPIQNVQSWGALIFSFVYDEQGNTIRHKYHRSSF